MSIEAQHAIRAAAAIQPEFEGDYVIDEVVPLKSGEHLVQPTQHYAIYGRLNAARDNAVLVAHALSGNAEVATWWPQLFTKPEAMLDLDRDCVIGIKMSGFVLRVNGTGFGRSGDGAAVWADISADQRARHRARAGEADHVAGD